MNKDISDKDYRAYPAESYSSIKHLLDSPQTFLYYKSKPFQGSDSTLLGTCIHHFIQGNRHLVAYNNIPRTSKANKEAYVEFEREFKELAGEDGIIVPKTFEEKINSVMTNFNDNKQALKLLNDAKIEEPFLFEYNGVSLKGKLDGVKKDSVIEIKTSSMATSSSEFRYEAYDRDYDLQAFLYCTASKSKHHFFIVANTTAPFAVNVYKSSAEFLLSGKQKADIVTERYKRHIINQEPFLEEEEIPEI